MVWNMLANRLVNGFDKGTDKGLRLANNHRGPRSIEWAKIPWGFIDNFWLTHHAGASYNRMKVAGRTVYRRKMGQSRYLELDRSTQLPLGLTKRQDQKT